MLVTYDIADADGDGAAQLRRIGDICSKYSQRVRHSVFECRLNASRMTRMTGEIGDAINMERDLVNCCRFPGGGLRTPLPGWSGIAGMGSGSHGCCSSGVPTSADPEIADCQPFGERNRVRKGHDRCTRASRAFPGMRYTIGQLHIVVQSVYHGQVLEVSPELALRPSLSVEIVAMAAHLADWCRWSLRSGLR
ncbi:MAG: CRISPR-associated endonuclease Cas2 [Boseongicola sp.]|nr:CRISPR-associated endonuclease Cas2 [Boseongicola sp.]